MTGLVKHKQGKVGGVDWPRGPLDGRFGWARADAGRGEKTSL
jgi:hypothetical protein